MTSSPSEHTELYECTHDCGCFWCKVSRHEKFETITDEIIIEEKAMDEAEAYDDSFWPE